MGFNLSTVLNAIGVISSDIPEFTALIAEVRAAFDGGDQATIDAAMAAADRQADAQHARAQGE